MTSNDNNTTEHEVSGGSSGRESSELTSTMIETATIPETNNLTTMDSQDVGGVDDGDDHGCVQVAVRVRPLLPHESGTTECVECLQSSVPNKLNVVRLGGSTGPKFTFDQVFHGTTPQSQVYDDRVAPLVENCLQGYNATILAYGQTGSGKSHTIMGPPGSMPNALLQQGNEEQHCAGVVPRAIRNIFHKLDLIRQKTASDDAFEYTVRVQFLEVYGEEIRDLLNPQASGSGAGGGSGASKLSIRDVGNDEPEVVGATDMKVDSAEEALLCLTRGIYRRVTGSTAMNETSSRSHAILSLIVEQSTVLPPTDGQQDPAQEHVQSKRSKFNFVDLAGSERQKRTQASGQRLKEGIDINKGLLVLGNVISALGDPKKQGKTHVPYRDSKLTRLLKGSLGGNHKTLMIACVSPSSSNLEESMNCLRYANRAKNIQNHAVVNVDATSQLVAELKSKVQRLAVDLMMARTGRVGDCQLPIEMVESLATIDENGQDESLRITQTIMSPSPRNRATPLKSVDQNRSPMLPRRDASIIDQNIELKAQNEAYKLQVESLAKGHDPSDALQQAYVTKATQYEKQISLLKNELEAQKSLHFVRGRQRTAERKSSNSSRERSESPGLSRLRDQVLDSLSQSSQLDDELEAAEKSSRELTEKYLDHAQSDADFGDDMDTVKRRLLTSEEGDAPDNVSVKLEADLYSISNSITAKEELIFQLQASQEQYASMRDFYEGKLREMESILAEKEKEAEKLSDELKKMDSGNVRSKELSARLKEKQEQLSTLRKKQAELTRITTVASRNESQITQLKNEVSDMKHKKVDLQKQITSMRKNHTTEVQKLKRESMQKERELNKTKRSLSKKEQEAHKASQMAKSRLEQMNQLKQKYKETEKRQRMQTVKRGVLKKAGLDPVMVGRRQPSLPSGTNTGDAESSIVNIDSLRELFDRKVADVSRRESLAEKLAQEWEDHLELTMQRDDLLQNENASQGSSFQAIESQIKFKEDRIRQLASRLGKREIDKEKDVQGDNSFMFDDEFEEVAGNVTSETSAKLAAKVLFGMVVRERRRIASLARTASSLDEKVQEAEASVASKEAAFRAYVDEQRLGAAAQAQNQQEHILTLMEIVKETPVDDAIDDAASEDQLSSRTSGNSKLLLLANERIAVLERQLNETQLGRDAIQQHREREESALEALEAAKQENIVFEEEIDTLRNALRRVREEITRGDLRTPSKNEEVVDCEPSFDDINSIVSQALHPSLTPMSSTRPRRRRTSNSIKPMGQSPSMTPRIKHDAQSMHSSDSDEIPDWADDILEDLAMIAEGKIPDSIKDSEQVQEAEAQINSQSNVFDRLSDPGKFTGVQKVRSTDTNRPNKSKPQPISTITLDGPKQSTSMGQQQIAVTFDKVFAPISDKERKKSSVGRKHKEKLASKSEAEKRSVFDRLLSPSNLTGTQKQRFRDQKGRTQPLEKAIDSQHVSVRTKTPQSENDNDDDVYFAPSNGSDLSEGAEADQFLDDILQEGTGKSAAMNDETSIPSQSVPKVRSPNDEFGVDGLSSSVKSPNHSHLLPSSPNYLNPTESFAKKQSTNIAEKMLDDILDDDDSENPDHSSSNVEPRFERVEQYTSEDVFERLQKKTTETWKKSHS
mmetsp:Transcript_56214/g.136237  ORF Transcript_56214/g.136237 Transcript_56214/m.136237 type:complete len:1623 (+) Transcript_56214:225-5093(+)